MQDVSIAVYAGARAPDPAEEADANTLPWSIRTASPLILGGTCARKAHGPDDGREFVCSAFATAVERTPTGGENISEHSATRRAADVEKPHAPRAANAGARAQKDGRHDERSACRSFCAIIQEARTKEGTLVFSTFLS